MASPLPPLGVYSSAEERWLAAVVERLDELNAHLAALLVALRPPAAPVPPAGLVTLQEPRPAPTAELVAFQAPGPVRRGPGRPRKGA